MVCCATDSWLIVEFLWCGRHLYHDHLLISELETVTWISACAFQQCMIKSCLGYVFVFFVRYFQIRSTILIQSSEIHYRFYGIPTKWVIWIQYSILSHIYIFWKEMSVFSEWRVHVVHHWETSGSDSKRDSEFLIHFILFGSGRLCRMVAWLNADPLHYSSQQFNWSMKRDRDCNS